MNFNVYINKKIGDRITKISKNLKRSRNSIVNEALEEWLEHHASPYWPAHFFDFEPIEDIPDFKQFRKDLKKSKDDPLG